MIEYYRTRAREYDKIYDRPERQADLQKAADILKDFFEQKDVIEVACGTGYWTAAMADTARSILATDINDTMVEIAQERLADQPKVQFLVKDMYELETKDPKDSLFGGFIWSHILLKDLGRFLDTMEKYIVPGGTLVFIDNQFIAGYNTPISHTDADGNTYQERQLQNGTTHQILKNFPTEAFLRDLIGDRASDIRYFDLGYYWILAYTKAE